MKLLLKNSATGLTKKQSVCWTLGWTGHTSYCWGRNLCQSKKIRYGFTHRQHNKLFGAARWQIRFWSFRGY